ncbi:MAG: ketoacyl-ACP synthase III [Actinobacteria bacterium]|uniref:Beta-ketoacyl-[acyl-carrier-protein] synthase III n=1 Tax=Candidatus Fonsibacter lacus TaxID=2576439 RepID=A0A965GCG2_9PROT|nr:ketoacyl-ACP synthase III [Candidatus Fonsibacter lacus]
MVAIKSPSAQRYSKIMSVGVYRPSRTVPNSEVIDAIDSSDEWIKERSGIHSRRIAGADESVISMSVAAAKSALERAGLSAEQLGAVICATVTYPFQTPSAATDIALQLGAPKIPAFDISAACAGFCYGVGIASDLVRAGSAEYVLLIGVEKLSDFTDPTDRGTAFIFADGAGAVIIGPSDTPGIGPMIWGSDATAREAIMMEPSWVDLRDPDSIGWPDIKMQGQTVFRWAVYQMAPVALEALAAAGISAEQLDAFIPHQANERITDAMAKAMNLPERVAIARDIRTSGNTSAASIPLAMDALYQENAIKSGGTALLIGFGAGLVYAAQVVQLP